MTAFTWIPPLWANALSPTKGMPAACDMFASSLTYLESSDSLLRFSGGTQGIPILI